MNCDRFSYIFFSLIVLASLSLLPLTLYGQQQEWHTTPTPQAIDSSGIEGNTFPADSGRINDSTDARSQMILENLIEALQERREERSALDLEIDGLIVDNTVTKSGRDFYDVFQKNWEPPKGAKNYTITIRELPSRGTMTMVTVEINDQKVTELPLQPRYDIVEEMALYAARSCYQYLENYEQIQQELSGEDLSGSGIY